DVSALMDLKVAQQDGSTVTLRALVKDKPAVLAFWASYCAPCKAEVPTLNRAAERWGSSGLRVIGVSLESDPAHLREARENWGMRYDVLAIAGGQEALAEKVFPRGLPVTAFVTNGTALIHDGYLEEATLAEQIPRLLAVGPPARPSGTR